MDLEDDEEGQKLFLVQMPSVLPISAQAVKEHAAGGGPSMSSATTGPSSSSSAEARRGCALKELPSGHIGRLLVYRSGKVKLQMGKVLMDVSPGLPCLHRIDVSSN
jgi:DNA-directed RNA polymerase III subunit RPC4